MTALTYGWLPVWAVLGGWLLPKAFAPQQRTLQQHRRWGVAPALLLVLPYVLFAAFRPDTLGDTAQYRQSFLQLRPGLQSALAAFAGGQKDPGYTALSALLKALIGNADVLFFLILAAFQMLSVALVLRAYAPDYPASIFLFIASTDYLSWMHNGMRQFLAVSIVFCGFVFLLQRRWVPLVLLILLASLFHISALLMLPVIFLVQGRAWNRKMPVLLAVTAVVMVFSRPLVALLTPLLRGTPYEDLTANEIWTGDDGVHILRVLVYSMPALLSLVGLRRVRQAGEPAMELCVNCSVVTLALYLLASVTSGIYVGRLPIYTTLFGYMALPWLCRQIFEPRSAKVVLWGMYGLYFLFFFYQTVIVWGGG